MAGVGGTGTQFSYGYEKQAWVLRVPISFSGTGTPALQKWNPSNAAGAGSYSAAPTSSSVAAAPSAPYGSRGVASVARSGQGDYTITLQGSYQRLLGAYITWVESGGDSGGNDMPAAPLMLVLSAGGAGPGTNVTTSGGGTVEVAFADTTAHLQNPSNWVDPVSGEFAILTLELDNSSV